MKLTEREKLNLKEIKKEQGLISADLAEIYKSIIASRREKGNDR